ncbi:MAG TPA: DUF1622 domain-containing protein [Thermoleophilaceae bacterium]|jgi:uncharacterized membrane protein
MIGHEKFKDGVESVAQLIDIAGVAIIVAGFLVATVLFIAGAIKRGADAEGYRGYRQQIGRAILLGLEFLVAADIIRTVAVAPTFRGVGVLAIIVAVRTFLSFTLEVELEGRWPWQKRATPAA